MKRVLLTGIVYMYIVIIFLEKIQWSTRNSLWYILYIRRLMRYLKIFSQFKTFNVINNGCDVDLGWTPRIILTAFFCKMKKGSCICFIRRSPNLITICHIRIYERATQTLQRFTAEYFSSLDYNPETTSALFTHQRYMNFPTQFILRNQKLLVLGD